MSDLEKRLSEGLAGTAERAPHPGDLTTGARERLRRRRWGTTGIVAAALAVVALPVGLGVAGQEAGDGDGPDRREPSPADTVPGHWRTETWRDLSVNVPQEWGFGGGTDWCADGRDPDEALQVSRPGGSVPDVACMPAFGYGAHFLQPSSGELPPGTEGVVQQYRGDRYPDEAWIGYAATGQSAVWVVAADRTTARLVLDSATPIGEVDANGCATRVEMGAPSTQAEVSVCRYSPDGWLEQSELLSKADTAAAVAAAGSAPSAVAVDTACPPSTSLEPLITLTSAQIQARLLPGRPCPLASVFITDERAERLLTEEVLYWALSPGWSGSVPRDVPLPEPLRGQ